MRSLKTMLRECTWGRSERRRAKETRTPVATLTSVDVLESRIVLASTPMVAGTPTVIDTPTTIDTPSVTLRNLDHDGAASADFEDPIVLTDQLIEEVWWTKEFPATRTVSLANTVDVDSAVEGTTAFVRNLDNDRTASAEIEDPIVLTDQMVTSFWKTDELTATRAASPANTGDVDSAIEGTTANGAGIVAKGSEYAVPADDRAITADSESTAAPILLPVIRTGSGEQALVVRNDASASASKHVDFLWAPRRVFDQARQTSIVVEMAPINDTIDEGDKDLFFGRLGDPSVSIGSVGRSLFTSLDHT